MVEQGSGYSDNQETSHDSTPEKGHTYRELCETFFEIKLGVAAYTHKPLTQNAIDRLPPMVRLANEQKIKDLGLQPNIVERVREKNAFFERIIPDEVYEAAVKDKGSLGNFFRPDRRSRRKK